MLSSPSHPEVFFITYDEPRADELWSVIRGQLPSAKRVHGVKGFDAAYKACAERSGTERFFTIDGDNLLEPAFFEELHSDFSAYPPDAVLSWTCRNSVNGLAYGYGGIKNWPRSVVSRMKTHENADLENGSVDFCFQLNYFQMPRIVSTTCVNTSPLQAFRSGFREGVKMCLERGQRPATGSRLIDSIARGNLDRLKIWCSVGADVENGDWAIYGARLGCHRVCLAPDWDYRVIRDYEWFRSCWKETIEPQSAEMPARSSALLRELNERLDLGIAELDADASRFFKSVYVNPARSGPMYEK